jgi:hypothetical protein
MQKNNSRTFLKLFGFSLLAVVLIGYSVGSVILTDFFTNIPGRGKLAVGSPGSFDLNYEAVAFQTTAPDKITLRGWWIPKNGSTKGMLLVHGKDGDRLQLLSISKYLWDRGFNILVFDMRSHGLSDGQRITYGKLEQYDIIGAVNFIKNRGVPAIGAVGWSMGAASILLAMGETTEIKAAVLDSPYGDFGRLAQARLGYLSAFYPGMLLACTFMCGTDLGGIKPEAAFSRMDNRKILLIHGELDGTVPVSEAYAIQKAGNANIAEAWLLPDVGHTNAYFRYTSEYLSKMLDFFERELK